MCKSESGQSPANLAGFQDNKLQEIFDFDVIPNISDMTLKMELKHDRILHMSGQFADFRTSHPQDGVEVVRDYRATRAEFHFPCEHILNGPCQMEMQIYAEETIHSTYREFSDKPNLVFVILFEEDVKGKYFDEAFTVDGKDYFQKVVDKGYDPNDVIKFNFMEALKLGDLLPSDKFEGTDRLQTLRYDGSIPYPDCQAVYHWHILKTKMKISKEKAEGLAKRFLKNELIFGSSNTNARAIQGPVVPLIVFWNMDAIKGFEDNPPVFIKGELGEEKFDNAPHSFSDHMLVAVCETEVGFYVVKVQEDQWDLTDATDGKVVYVDDKNGGFSHISCVEGSIFFVKDKHLQQVNLPIDIK